MGLELKICVLQNGCDGLYFFEKTGAYDAALNTTGWGAPNPTTAQATAATLSILYAGATTAVVIDVLPTLPTTNSNAYYNVTDTALGLSEMPSGLTRVTYSVTAAGTTYTATANVLFDCSLACCVSAKLIDAASAVANGDCCDECKEDKVKTALFFEAVLEGARANTCSGQVDAVDTCVDYLVTQCAATPCDGC